MSGFVQIAENFDATSTLHVTLSLGPFSSPTTAGNRIVVLVLFNDTTGGTGSVPSITDTALNTYTPIGNAGTGLFNIFVSGQYMAYAFEVESSAANAANTVLVTWSLVTGASTANFVGAAAVEYSGTRAATASYAFSVAQHYGSSPGEIAVTPTTIGDLAVGWINVLGQSASSALNTLRGSLNSGWYLLDEETTVSLSPINVGANYGSSTAWCEIAIAIPMAAAGLAVSDEPSSLPRYSFVFSDDDLDSRCRRVSEDLAIPATPLYVDDVAPPLVPALDPPPLPFFPSEDFVVQPLGVDEGAGPILFETETFDFVLIADQEDQFVPAAATVTPSDDGIAYSFASDSGLYLPVDSRRLSISEELPLPVSPLHVEDVVPPLVLVLDLPVDSRRLSISEERPLPATPLHVEDVVPLQVLLWPDPPPPPFYPSEDFVRFTASASVDDYSPPAQFPSIDLSVPTPIGEDFSGELVPHEEESPPILARSSDAAASSPIPTDEFVQTATVTPSDDGPVVAPTAPSPDPIPATPAGDEFVSLYVAEEASVAAVGSPAPDASLAPAPGEELPSPYLLEDPSPALALAAPDPAVSSPIAEDFSGELVPHEEERPVALASVESYPVTPVVVPEEFSGELVPHEEEAPTAAPIAADSPPATSGPSEEFVQTAAATLATDEQGGPTPAAPDPAPYFLPVTTEDWPTPPVVIGLDDTIVPPAGRADSFDLLVRPLPEEIPASAIDDASIPQPIAVPSDPLSVMPAGDELLSLSVTDDAPPLPSLVAALNEVIRQVWASEDFPGLPPTIAIDDVTAPPPARMDVHASAPSPFAVDEITQPPTPLFVDDSGVPWQTIQLSEWAAISFRFADEDFATAASPPPVVTFPSPGSSGQPVYTLRPSGRTVYVVVTRGQPVTTLQPTSRTLPGPVPPGRGPRRR